MVYLFENCCRSFGDNNEDYNKPLVHDEVDDILDDYDDGCGDACTWLWYVRALHRLSKQGQKEDEKVEEKKGGGSYFHINYLI